ncbi:hypothetical protein JCM10213v2_002471 [Rhodosporidiobolus nylandii]
MPARHSPGVPSPSPPPQPSAASLSPHQHYANSNTSSSSSTRTNTGFVVTSRPKHYAPPPSPSAPSPTASRAGGQRFPTREGRPWFDGPSYPYDSSTTPYPPPVASGSGLLTAGFPPVLGARRGSSPAALPTAATATETSSSRPSSRQRQRERSAEGGAGGGGAGGGTGSAGGSKRASADLSHPPATEPKTTLTLSSSIDSKGRRMVNQYVRLKTIGQGSHGKVWLCAEPTVREDEEGEEGEEDFPAAEGEGGEGRTRRRRRRTASERWEDDIDSGRVQYCAIKSVARDGPGAASGGRGKSLRAAAKSKKASAQGSGGIGADDKVKREVAIMKRLDHPNIVRLKEVIDDAKSKKVFMVLEFMAGGQVVWQDENKQPTMTVDEARRTFRDVVLGLEYLHYQGIIHRDIKPANLLWTEDHSTVKISDFGVSHVSEALLRCSADDPAACSGHDGDDKALRKTAGSPAFFAPELCHPAELTPTPNGHPASNAGPYKLGGSEPDAYFSYGIDSTHLAPSPSPSPDYVQGGAVYSPSSVSPNGIPLSSKLISVPLPPPTPHTPRARPPVGKGIDVWALGVTLYCLLFGDTPFTARTEYELYNVIVREAVRVPSRMGREGAWTGVPPGWEGCGDGAEGREVVDLLGRLLEKDPTKRITLDEVKHHPWVLRNLSSPDNWLHTTDPGRIDHVTVTEEDVEHATQERGSVDTLPPIRNRPGIRRALNAALSRFPAFSRIKSTRTTASTNSEDAAAAGTQGEGEPHSRSKSNSSDGAFTSEAGTGTVSRQPSDGSKAPAKQKLSHEFGAELRRIISGASNSAVEAGTPRSPSPAHGIRGGWGNRSSVSRKSTLESSVSPTSPTSPTSAAGIAAGFPELARSISSSSVHGGGSGGNRGGFTHHLFARKISDVDGRAVASVASSPSAARASFTPAPWAGSDTEGSGTKQRTLSRMLSKLGGGGGGASGTASLNSSQSRSRSAKTPDRQLSGSTDDGAEEVLSVAALGSASPGGGIDPHVVEQFEASGERFDALGRLITKKKDAADSRLFASGLTAAKKELDAAEAAGEDDDLEDGAIDLTEFEYSESDDEDDEDDLDDFMRPALAAGNHLSGWSRPDFGDFRIGVRSPSEDDAVAAGLYSSSATGTPPTDELEPLDENEHTALHAQPPRRKPSPPQPDNVNFAFVPLDYDDFLPTAPLSSPPLAPPHPAALPPPSAASHLPTFAPAPPSAPTYNSISFCSPLAGHSSDRDSDSPSPRDGSIRGVSTDPTRKGLAAAAALGRAWQQAEEEDGEEEEEMLVVPARRRRAATLNSPGPTSGAGTA